MPLGQPGKRRAQLEDGSEDSSGAMQRARDVLGAGVLGAGTYHQHIPYDTGPRVQFLGVLSPQCLQVHAHARKEVLWLPNVHPEACGDRATVTASSMRAAVQARPPVQPALCTGPYPVAPWRRAAHPVPWLGRSPSRWRWGAAARTGHRVEQGAQPLSLAQPGAPARTWMRCKMPGLNM